MKRTWLFAVVLLALASPARANDRDWTHFDTVLELGCVTALALDWSQSRNPDGIELNPILGKYPSATEVDVYFAVATIGHAAIAWALPKPYRTVWQSVWLGVEINVVRRNYTLGYGFKF